MTRSMTAQYNNAAQQQQNPVNNAMQPTPESGYGSYNGCVTDSSTLNVRSLFFSRPSSSQEIKFMDTACEPDYNVSNLESMRDSFTSQLSMAPVGGQQHKVRVVKILQSLCSENTHGANGTAAVDKENYLNDNNNNYADMKKREDDKQRIAELWRHAHVVQLQSKFASFQHFLQVPHVQSLRKELYHVTSNESTPSPFNDSDENVNYSSMTEQPQWTVIQVTLF